MVVNMTNLLASDNHSDIDNCTSTHNNCHSRSSNKKTLAVLAIITVIIAATIIATAILLPDGTFSFFGIDVDTATPFGLFFPSSLSTNISPIAFAQTQPQQAPTPSIFPPSHVSALFDSSDPTNLALTNPTSVDIITIGEKIYAIAASDSDDGIQIVDITTPGSPTAVSNFTSDDVGTANSLDGAFFVTTAVINDTPYALVASSNTANGGFTIIDISDPESPSLASHNREGINGFTTLRDTSSISVITIDNTPYALVASIDGGGGIHVVDISDPSSPSVEDTVANNIGGIENLAAPRSVSTAFINDTPYVIVASHGSNSIQIFDMSDPTNLDPVSFIRDTGQPDIALRNPVFVTTTVIDGNTYAIAASKIENGIQILNITDPTITPVLISNVVDDASRVLDDALSIDTIVLNGDTYAIVASNADDGIQFINITNPNEPGNLSAVSDGVGGFTALDGPSYVSAATINGYPHIIVASADSNALQIMGFVHPPAITLSTTAMDPTGLVSITFFVSFSESVTDFTPDDVEVSSGTVSEIGRRYDLVSSIGSTRGDGNNQFDTPYGIDIDSNGRLYVADSKNYVIKVYDTRDDNAYVNQYMLRDHHSSLTEYRGVFVDTANAHLWVTQTSEDEHRIERFDFTDNLGLDTRIWGELAGSNNRLWDNPLGLTLSADRSFIYIADSGNHRVKVHDPSNPSAFSSFRGDFGRTFIDPNLLDDDPSNDAEDGGNDLPIPDPGPLGLVRPTDVALNSTGFIYVTDAGLNLVKVYGTVAIGNTHTFTFIAQFDGSTSGTAFDGPLGIIFDSQGNIYIADTGNNRIVVFDSTHTFLYQIDNLGLGTDHPNSLNGPADLTIDPDTGMLYVTNMDGHNVLVYDTRFGFNVVNSTDLQTLTVRIPEGTVQDSSGDHNPLGSNTISLEVDRMAPTVKLSLAAGTPDPTYFDPVPFVVSFSEYITEFVRDDITVVTPNTGTIPSLEPVGIALSALGTSGISGSNDDQFDSPEGIAIDTNGRIYIADNDNRRIKIYQGGENGASYVKQFTLLNIGSPSRTVDATGLAIDTAGNRIYAIGADPERLVAFRLDGNNDDVWNRDGGGSGSTAFARPQGIALTPDGNLVIADTRNNRIAIWNTTTGFDNVGRPIAHFGGTVLSEPSEDGRGEGEFYQPRDVAFNSTGYLYVADSGNDLIQVINNTIDDIEQLPDAMQGTINTPDESLRGFLTEFNGTGLAPDDTFQRPEGIAFDSQDRLYIADTGNDRIVVFDNTHTFLYQIDNDFLAEDDPNRLNEPTDVVIDPDNNNLYVANRGGHNVIIYTEHPSYRFGVASAIDQNPVTVRMAAGVVDDVDGIPNTLASNEVTVNVDRTPPVLVTPQPVLDLVDGTLRFDFDETIDISQIDLDGISISGSNGGNRTVLSGAAINTASLNDDSNVVIVQLTGTQRLGIIDVNHNDGPVLLNVTNTAIPNIAGLGFEGLDNADINLVPPAPIPLHQPVPVSTIFESDDPDNLALDGAISVSTITFDDGYTYAVAAANSGDHQGISIINITNPLDPIPLSNFINGTDSPYLAGAWSVDTVIIDDIPYALVAASGGTGGGFVIVNISDPGNPMLTSNSTTDDPGFTELRGARAVSAVTIGGVQHALVGSNTGDSIHVVDISTPAAPDVVSTITHGVDNFLLDGPRSISHVTINDISYAVVASFSGNHTQIINMNDPANPVAASNFVDDVVGDDLVLSGPRSVDTALIDGNVYAVVTSQHENGISIINITTPTASFVVSNVTGAISDNGLALGGARSVDIVDISGNTYAVVAGRTDDGIQIIDITDPTDPVPIRVAIDDNGGDNDQGFMALNGASSVDTISINGSTYAVVASNQDDAIQIIDLVGAPFTTVSTVITSPSTPQRTVPITVTFSEPVMGFMENDILVSSGMISAFTTVSASEYTFNVENSNNLEPLRVDIRAAAALDGQGLHNTASNRFSINIDHNALFAFTTPIPSDDISVNVPYTVTVSLGAAVTTDPTDIDPVPFVVSFSRPVIGFTPDDIDISQPSGTVTNFVKPVLLSINNTLGLGKDGITFNDVRDVATNSSGHIYVTDRNNHRVLIFDSIGTPVGSIGTLGQTGTTNDLFNQPAGLFINASNHVFITDASNHRVQIYDSNNVYQQTIGEIPFDADGDVEPSGGGDGPNEFKFTVDVATNSSGHIFITDNNNHRVQIYTSSGIYQSSIGSRSVDADGDPDDDNPDPDNLNRPFGVTINSTDHIYIADTLNARVSVWDNSGNHLFNFGPDNTPGGYNLGLIGRIVFDSEDNLYVTDNSNGTIVVYDKTNTYQYYIGKNDSSGNPIAGSGPLEFNNHDGLHVDSNTGLLYVADRNNMRVQIINIPTPLPDYTFDIANTRNGLLSIHVPANKVENLQGNPNLASDPQTVTIQRVGPENELYPSSVPVLSDGVTILGAFTRTASSVPAITSSATTTGSFTLSASSTPAITSSATTTGSFTLSASSVPVPSDTAIATSPTGPATVSASSTPAITSSATSIGAFTVSASSVPIPSDTATAATTVTPPTTPPEPPAEMPSFVLPPPTAVFALDDNSTLALDGAVSVTTIEIQGSTYAIATSINEGVQILNITDPTRPTHVSSIFDGDADINGNTYDHLGGAWFVTTTILNNIPYALVASNGESGFTVINISEPANPTFVADASDGSGGFTLLGGARYISVADVGGLPHAFVASAADNGIEIIGLSDLINLQTPAGSPVITNGSGADSNILLESPRAISTVTIGGTLYAVVASQDSHSLQILDLTTLATPTHVSQIVDNSTLVLSEPRSVTTVVIDGDTYAIATSQVENGIQIVNITDPVNPNATSQVVHIDGEDNLELVGARHVTTVLINENTYALVAGRAGDGIQIIDITDPVHPNPLYAIRDDENGFTELQSVSFIDTAVINGNTYAIAASNQDSGLQIIDLVGAPNATLFTSIAQGETTNQNTIPFTVSFSEPVTGGFTLEDDNVMASAGTLQDLIPTVLYDDTFVLSETLLDNFNAPTGIHVNSSGHIFVADNERRQVYIFDSSYNLQDMIGDGANTVSDTSIVQPRDIATNSTGHIFVTEFGGDRVHIFDSSGDHEGVILTGEPGVPDNELVDPFGILINTTDHIFVVDRGNQHVQVFNSTNHWVQTIEGSLNRPTGIAINSDNGNIYVSTIGNDDIVAFDSAGNNPSAFGANNADATRDLINPQYLTFGSTANGNNELLYVSDVGNERVVVYNSTTNTFLYTFNGTSIAPGDTNQDTFGTTSGITVDPATNQLYVVSPANDHIQIYDTNAYSFNVADLSDPTALLQVQILAGAVQDEDGLNNTPSNIVPVTTDYSDPEVSQATADTVRTITLHMSEPVTITGDPSADFTLVGIGSTNTIGTVEISSNSSQVILTLDGTNQIGPADNSITISYARTAGFINDTAGNTLADISVGIPVSTDSLDFAPAETTLALGSGITSPTALEIIPFIVNFSKPVNGFEFEDISVSPAPAMATDPLPAEPLRFAVGEFGTDPDNNFFSSRGMDILESTGHLYIADTQNNRIKIHDGRDPSGQFVREIDTTSNQPYDVAVSLNADYIFSAIDGNNRLLVFHHDNGTAAGSASGVGVAGGGNNQFQNPEGLAISPAGSLIVADTGNNRIKIHQATPTAPYIGEFGTSGSGDGQFNAPANMAFNSTGHLFVVDTGNNRIQVFDNTIDANTYTYLAEFNGTGIMGDEFVTPRGIAFDSKDNIYVTDTGNDRILIFDNTNTYQSQINNDDLPSNDPDRLVDPYGIAVDNSTDVLYVVNNAAVAGSPPRLLAYDTDAGDSYTFNVINAPGGGNTLRVSIPANIAHDGSGVGNDASDEVSIVVERPGDGNIRFGTSTPTLSDNARATSTTIPSLTATSTPTPSDSATLTGSFTRTASDIPAITDRATADTESAVSAFSTPTLSDDTIITGAFTATATSTPTLTDGATVSGMFSVSASSTPTITDDANIMSLLTATLSFSNDISDPTNLDTIPFTVSFSSPVTGFTLNDVSASLGTRSNLVDLPLTRSDVFGSFGTGTNNLRTPFGVAFNSSGHVFVADGNNHRIQIFDSQGDRVGQIGTGVSVGSADGQFNFPVSIVINATNHIFVTDFGNHRVQIFNSTNDHQLSIGGGPNNRTAGTANGSFDNPEGLALNSSGYIFVGDADNNRVQIFDPSYRHQLNIGGGPNNRTAGTGNGSFTDLEGIAINSLGNIYVADTGNDRVQVFDSSGRYQTQFGNDNDDASDNFNSPRNIAIDSGDNIFVTERNNDRIAIYDDTHTLQFLFGANRGDGTSGSSIGQFNSPNGIQVDSVNDLLYITEANNNRVQVYNLPSSIEDLMYGLDYHFEILSTSSGQLEVSIPAGGAQDAITPTITNEASNVLSVGIDITAPTVSSIAAVTAFDIHINFSEAITNNIDRPADFTIISSLVIEPVVTAVNTLNDTAISLTLEGDPLLDNDNSIIVGYAKTGNTGTNNIRDMVGNNLAGFTEAGIDNNVASAGALISIATTATDPTNLQSIPFTASFNRAVTGFELGDITITPSTATASNPVEITASSYTFDVVGIPVGTLSVFIGADTVQSSDGNADNALPSNTVSRVIERTPPTILFAAASLVDTIHLTMSEPVSNNSTLPSAFTINGVSNAVVSNVSVSSNGTILTLRLSDGLIESDDVVSITYTETTPGITNIHDAAGNSLETGTVTISDTSMLDFVSPVITLSSIATSPTNRGTIPFVVTFSQPVSGFTLSDVEFTHGTIRNLVHTLDHQDSFGDTGTQNGNFSNPEGIAIHPINNNIYVADIDQHRVQIFDGDTGIYIDQIGTTGSAGTGNNQLDRPRSVTFDSAGNLFVADRAGNTGSIRVYDSNNALLETINNAHTSSLTLTNPQGIAVNSSGHIFIADASRHNIQILDSSYALQDTIGTTNTAGDGEAELENPTGVAVNSAGYIYVSDRANNRISVFDSSGDPVTQFGNETGNGNNLDDPRYLTFDVLDNLYVTDSNNNRILVFDSENNYQYKVGAHNGNGSAGTGTGEFDNPRGITLDSTGTLYITDNDNDRVQIFNTLAINSTFGIADAANGDTLTVSIPADAVQSMNRVYNAAPTATLSFVIDMDVPTVDSITAITASRIDIAVNEPVTNNEVNVADFAIDTTNPDPTVQSIVISPDGQTIQLLLTGARLLQDGDTITLSYSNSGTSPDNNIPDVAGNPLANFNSQSVTNEVALSGPVPTITTSTTNPTNADPITFTVSFDRAVTGFDISADITVTPATATATNPQIVPDLSGMPAHNANIGTGSAGFATNQLDDPTDVAINSTGYIYVADFDNHRISIFNSTGHHQDYIGGGANNRTAGDTNGTFNRPIGIFIDDNDRIYVSDFNNHRVQIFNPSNGYEGQFGQNGRAIGNFSGPRDIATNSSGHIFVADQNSHRVQIFDPSGNPLGRIGGGPPDGNGFTSGSGDDLLNSPIGIAINSTNHIFIADSGNNRTTVWDSSGSSSIARFGSDLGGLANFNSLANPSYIAFDSDNNFYVSDSDNNRIVVFDSHSTPIAQFGQLGSNNGSFNNPSGLAIDSENNLIHVADNNNHRIQTFARPAVTTFDVINAPDGETLTVSIPAGAVQEVGTGTDNVLAASVSRLIDRTAPEIESAVFTGIDTIEITMSEDVTGAIADRFFITVDMPADTINGAAVMISGNIITLTLDGAITADNIEAGTLRLESAGSTGIRDLAGNTFSLTPFILDTGTVNFNVPTVTLSTDSPQPTNESTITITATFDPPTATGFAIGDITVSPNTATVENFVAATNTFDVSGLTTGLLNVTIAANAVTDPGNGLQNVEYTQSFVIDQDPPTISGAVANGPGTILIEFDEAITVNEITVPGDFTINSNLTGTQPTVSAVTMHNATTASLTLDGTDLAENTGMIMVTYVKTLADDINNINDTAGNNLEDFTNESVTNAVATSGPSIILTSTESSPTDADPIPVTATFSSAPGTSFTANDITVSHGSVPEITEVTPTSYTFNVIGVPDGAALTILIDANRVSNADGRLNMFASNTLFIDIDRTGPIITSVTAPDAFLDGTYGAGSVLDIQVVFGEAVSFTGTDTDSIQLELNIGNADDSTTSRQAIYQSGADSDTLLFQYTIVTNDRSSGQLDYTSASAITFDGTVANGVTGITDVNNVASDLVLQAPGSANSLSGNRDIIIDARAEGPIINTRGDTNYVLKDSTSIIPNVITISSSRTNATLVLLDDSFMTNTNEYTIPTAFNVTNTRADGGPVTVSFLANTAITGTGFNGRIILPNDLSDDCSELPTEGTADSNLVSCIQIGLNNGELSVPDDKPVRIMLEGQASNTALFTNDGGSTVTEITQLCDSDSVGGFMANECHIDVDDDLIIWTNHFTVFGSSNNDTRSTGGGGSSNGDSTAPSFTTSFDEGTNTISIGDIGIAPDRFATSYTLDAPVTVRTGSTLPITLTLYENISWKSISHVELCTNKQVSNNQICDSDTKIIWDTTSNGNTENEDGTVITANNLEIVDPNGIIQSATLVITEVDSHVATFEYDVIFSGTMSESDLQIYTWDTRRNALAFTIEDAIVVVAGSSGNNNNNGGNGGGSGSGSGSGTGTRTTTTPTTDGPQTSTTVTDGASIVTSNGTRIDHSIPNAAFHNEQIKKWAGFASESITDGQLLASFEITNNPEEDITLPSWTKDILGKWAGQDKITAQQVKTALSYMYDNLE